MTKQKSNKNIIYYFLFIILIVLGVAYISKIDNMFFLEVDESGLQITGNKNKYENINESFFNDVVKNLKDDGYIPKTLEQIKKGNSSPFRGEEDDK